jgi:hypothetical protein
MTTIPLGSELNLALQLLSFLLILVGVRYAIRTHGAYAAGTPEASERGQAFEKTHKNLMTSAVVVSGLGVLIWMLPNFLLGWFYDFTGNALGYGSGGYLSYLQIQGAYLPHWYLIPLMVGVGSLTAVLGVYLVLRMRWSGFPKSLAVQNFRAVMITTWSLWVVNVFVGFLVFYYFAYLQTG